MKSIYEECVGEWGVGDQIEMVIEECSELILALQHYKRNRVGKEEVAEEAADVRLMLNQLDYILGGNLIANWEEFKLARLRSRLAKSKARKEEENA